MRSRRRMRRAEASADLKAGIAKPLDTSTSLDLKTVRRERRGHYRYVAAREPDDPPCIPNGRGSGCWSPSTRLMSASESRCDEAS